jgi:hypothetical protein
LKKILIMLLLFTGILPAEENAPSKDEIELEYKRIELEWQRIELEKQKLEFQKQKFQNELDEYIIVEEETPPPDTASFTKNMYLGFDLALAGKGRRTLSINSAEETSEGIQTDGYGIKLGFGTPDKNRVEIFSHRYRYRFDSSPDDWDVDIYGIDYVFVFYDSLDEALSPYLQIGYTIAESYSYTHTLNALGYTVEPKNSTTSGTGFKFGFGLLYLISERAEATFGMEYINIIWNDIILLSDTASDRVEFADKLNTYRVSIHYYF